MKLFEALSASKSDASNAAPFQYGVARQYMSPPGSVPRTADGSFDSMVADVHDRSGPISSAVTARALLLSEVRFAWSDPADPSSGLSRTSALDRLEYPASMTRGEMLYRLEQDVSYAGNAFLAVHSGQRGVFRLDPSRVTFAFRSNSDPEWSGSDEPTLPSDARVVGIVYNSGDNRTPPSIGDLEVFNVGEFFHWKPEPDPIYWWRGQSWITALLRDVALDGQISDHQTNFFQHAATPNLVFVMDPDRTQEEVKAYADIVNARHAGADNAYRNMFLGGAVDVKTVGADLSSLSLKDLQGGLESRIAMRSRVPAVILGAREGLSGSSLNTGNYSAARRLFADGWFSPTVNGLCEGLESLVPPPPGRRLTHDPSRILFLQEDRKDEAEISGLKVTAIRTLADGGYDPMSAVATIAPEWVGKLDHAGLLSVQLQEPGAAGAGSGGGDTGGDAAEAQAHSRELAEIVQKIYLGVGVVLTAEEARSILNDAGASLSGPLQAVSNSTDARTVMGRLGRVDHPELVDPDLLVDGIDPVVAATVLRVLDQMDTDDMAALRADVSRALTGDK